MGGEGNAPSRWYLLGWNSCILILLYPSCMSHHLNILFTTEKRALSRCRSRHLNKHWRVNISWYSLCRSLSFVLSLQMNMYTQSSGFLWAWSPTTWYRIFGATRPTPRRTKALLHNRSDLSRYDWKIIANLFRKYQAGILILYKFVGFVRCVECNRSCRFVKYIPEYATADQEKFVFHTIRIFVEKPCQAQLLLYGFLCAKVRFSIISSFHSFSGV